MSSSLISFWSFRQRSLSSSEITLSGSFICYAPSLQFFCCFSVNLRYCKMWKVLVARQRHSVGMYLFLSCAKSSTASSSVQGFKNCRQLLRISLGQILLNLCKDSSSAYNLKRQILHTQLIIYLENQSHSLPLVHRNALDVLVNRLIFPQLHSHVFSQQKLQHLLIRPQNFEFFKRFVVIHVLSFVVRWIQLDPDFAVLRTSTQNQVYLRSQCTGPEPIQFGLGSENRFESFSRFVGASALFISAFACSLLCLGCFPPHCPMSEFYYQPMQQEEPEEILTIGGIPCSLLVHSPVNIDFLLCPICLNILWNPVACSQDRCFSSFCLICIESWIRLNPSQIQTQTPREDDLFDMAYYLPYNNKSANCPKCKRTFAKTQIPLIRNLLDQISLKCVNEDCPEVIKYSDFEAHQNECPYRKRRCQGCQEYVYLSEIQAHESSCDQMMVECAQCSFTMTKQTLRQSHDKYNCIANKFARHDYSLRNVQEQISLVDDQLQAMENKINRITVGELLKIEDYGFSTVFTSNYQFTNDHINIVRLIRNSYNHSKQKNDYLHFYIDHKFPTGLVGHEWKIRIIRLRGFLLLGICNSQAATSVDYIINKQGEIKKKEAHDNRYQNIRQVYFSFGEGDVIQFQYLPLAGCVRVKNESRHQIFSFQKSEIEQMGGSFFSFFSLEYQGDALQFF